MVPLPSWFGDGVPESWEMTPGALLLMPGYQQHYLLANRADDTPRRWLWLGFGLGGKHDLPSGPLPAMEVRDYWATLVYVQPLQLPAGTLRGLSSLVEILAQTEESQFKSNKGGWQSQADFFDRSGIPELAVLRTAIYRAMHAYLTGR